MRTYTHNYISDIHNRIKSFSVIETSIMLGKSYKVTWKKKTEHTYYFINIFENSY